jgi:hypothetical protein
MGGEMPVGKHTRRCNEIVEQNSKRILGIIYCEKEAISRQNEEATQEVQARNRPIAP